MNVTDQLSKYFQPPNETDLNWQVEVDFPNLNAGPWYWYYRDKPLSTANNEKTADFWID